MALPEIGKLLERILAAGIVGIGLDLAGEQFVSREGHSTVKTREPSQQKTFLMDFIGRAQGMEISPTFVN